MCKIPHFQNGTTILIFLQISVIIGILLLYSPARINFYSGCIEKENNSLKEERRVNNFARYLKDVLRFKVDNIGRSKIMPNPFNVTYVHDMKAKQFNKTMDYICDAKKMVDIEVFTNKQNFWREQKLGGLFKEEGLFDELTPYNSCAILSNSEGIIGNNLGSFIDSHDYVIRLNNGPTKGYEEDFGTKTTLRIINEIVITYYETFEFFTSDLYQNCSLAILPSCDYNQDMKDWFYNPRYNIIWNFRKKSRLHPNQKHYIIDPHSSWVVWRWLQTLQSPRLLPRPPSLGFISLMIAMKKCRIVRFFGFIPTMSESLKCHYFDDMSCDLNDPSHPRTAEKLATLNMNSATPKEVYEYGILTIKGFSECKENEKKKMK